MPYIYAGDSRYIRKRMLLAAISLLGELLVSEIHGSGSTHPVKKPLRGLLEGKAAEIQPVSQWLSERKQAPVPSRLSSLFLVIENALKVVEGEPRRAWGDGRLYSEAKVFEDLHNEATRLKVDASVDIILHGVRSSAAREEASLKLNAEEIYRIVDSLSQLEE